MNAPQKSGKQTLDEAFDQLEAELPQRAARAVHWTRGPRARWVRLPLGILAICFAVFWFMPIIGLEWLPIGLLLIALDVPFMQRPVGLFILWLLEKWKQLRARYAR